MGGTQNDEACETNSCFCHPWKTGVLKQNRSSAGAGSFPPAGVCTALLLETAASHAA